MFRLCSLALLCACSITADPNAVDAPPEALTCVRVAEGNVRLSVGGEAAGSTEVEVLVENGCEQEAWLDRVQLAGADPNAFAVDAPAGRVRAKDSMPLQVSLLATESGTYTAEVSLVLQVGSRETTQRFTLEAQVQRPALVPSPSEIVTPTVLIGCERAEPIRIENTGDATARIAALAFEEEGTFHLDDPPELPASLAPGESLELQLVATPLGDAEAKSALLVLDDSGARLTRIPLSSRGRAQSLGSDVDTVPTPFPSQVDLLLTVDRSSCNTDTIAEVGGAISHLFDEARSAGTDLRMTVVAADDGCPRGHDWIDTGWSSRAIPDAFARMADMNFALAPYGANAERAFSIAEAARSTDNLAPRGCNENFWREDAFWQVVHISDEPEQSAGWTAETYVTFWESERGGPVRIHGVGGEMPRGCASASPAFKVDKAVSLSGGRFTSICQDGETIVEELTEGILAPAPGIVDGRLPLSETPVVATLEVRIDGGVLPPEDWRFESVSNNVVVEEAARPSPGGRVEASYVVQPATCE